MANLEVGTIGRDFWDKQVNDDSLPGLYAEVEEHLNALGGEANLREESKFFFKKKVKEYIKKKDREELLEDIGRYKKLDKNKLENDAFERKEYLDKLNLEDGRTRMRIEAKLIPTILGNYPSLHRRRGKSLVCPSCSPPVPGEIPRTGARESEVRMPPSPSPPLHSQSHLLSGQCDGVRDLLENCDPMDDKSLVTFFRRVVARNMELEQIDEP